MLSHYGTEAAKWRQADKVRTKQCITFRRRGSSFEVPITQSYIYLGKLKVPYGEKGTELRRRAAVVRSTTKPFKRELLNPQDVDHDAKMGLIQSLFMSQAYYGVAGCANLSCKEVKPLQRAVVDIYREASGTQRWRKWRISDAEVMQKLVVMLPRIRAIWMRLALFIRLLEKPYLQVMSVLACAVGSKQSWLGCICKDH